MTFTTCRSSQFRARIRTFHAAVLTAGKNQIVNTFSMQSWHLALTPEARAHGETDKGVVQFVPNNHVVLTL